MAPITVDTDKVVSFTYSILNEKGDVVEQSDLPLDYLHGGINDMFPKVEQALNGKTVGDRIEVSLSPQEGFGEKDPILIIVDDLDNAPPEYRFVGAKPVFQNENGDMLEMTVTHMDGNTITIDGNNPLAGQTVTFCITVAGIREASDAEKKNGVSNDSNSPYLSQ